MALPFKKITFLLLPKTFEKILFKRGWRGGEELRGRVITEIIKYKYILDNLIHYNVKNITKFKS